MYKNIRILIFSFIFLVLLFAGLSITNAAPTILPDILVDSDADTTTAGDDECTLREAINNANSDSDGTSEDCAAGSGTDTIGFTGNFTITLTGSQLPAVSSEIAIYGNGASNTIIQANASPNTATYRVIQVGLSGNLTLNGMTVRNGRCNGSCTGSTHHGAGIHNFGTLTIKHCAISGNNANYGGGISNGGTLTVYNSTISDNSVGSFYGGGIDNSNTLYVTNSTFSGNSAAYGGGFRNGNGTATIANSTFYGNSASVNGGGIFTQFSCFTANAQVLLASGGRVSIANLVVGDEVLSYDFSSGRQTTNTVTHVMSRPASEYLRINELEVTPEHPFAVGENLWRLAGELRIGDRILSDSGWTTVETISRVLEDVKVYNITVEGTNNYYVSDGEHTYLAHNKASASEVTLNNSIIANSTGGDCYNSNGSFTGGFNLIDDHDGGACAAISAKAVTNFDSALADNGGPTQTHALLWGSNAINAGSDALAVDAGGSPLTTDQRGVGFPRFVGASVDIGAYEAWLPLWLPLIFR